MQRKDPDLPKIWQGFDDLKKELVLYLTHLPSPVSIDTLVFLSQTSVMSILSAVEDLKGKRVIVEKKGKEKGLYFLNHSDPAGFIREHVKRGQAQRALTRITEFYQGSPDKMGDGEIVKLAGLYQKTGASGDAFGIIKKAADILARLGEDEKAVRYYEHCLGIISDGSVTHKNAEDFLDCVLGRVSILIYHMSAQDEVSLLNRAKWVAKRFNKRDRLARLEIVMAQILQTLGEHKKAAGCFDEFIKLVKNTEDPKMAKAAVLATCEFLFWRGRFSDVVNHYEKTIGSLEEFGDDEASLKAAALVGCCFVIRGRIARGMGMIETVRAKGLLLGFHQVTIFTDQMMVLSLFELRRVSEAEFYLDRLSCVSEDSLGYLISRAINDERAFILCQKGEYQKAFDCHQRGVLHARSLGWKHHCGPWVFEYLDILESKGLIDEEVNYSSEIKRLVKWDDLRMKGAAFRYRALRKLYRHQSLDAVLPDLKASEKYLEQAGAEIELARTRIALGRYFLNEDSKTAKSYLERAWAVLSRIDKNLFPKDLLTAMPEERKLEVMVERMIQINESLGTIRDQRPFLEKVIEVAMDFVMATRGAFLIPKREGGFKQAASRNLDSLLFESDRFKMVRAVADDAARKGIELVFPQQKDDGHQAYEKIFSKAGIQSFIGVPAQLAGRTYGYLCLDNRLGGEPFSRNQLPLVRFLCSQISVGLSNLETFEEMKELKDRYEEEAIFYKREMGITPAIEMIGGKSEGMRRVINRIRQVAPTDTSVLILGETGVGKELVAKAIHNLSNRSGGPFIPVNLAAIPPELVASELFGHEKGAFTGAHERRKGRFELADGGTIFLDEIGDLPHSVQVKLLRVLQEGTFDRLGNAQHVRSEFRVVAATNKDLRAEVLNDAFRRDLYYRLDVFSIHVPPLRERKENIPDLAHHFVEKFCKKLGRRGARIPRAQMKKLIDYAWPGNVRELEHSIEQALILSDGTGISFPDLVRPPSSSISTLGYERDVMTLQDLERDYIERILNMSRWKVMGPGGAASILGMKPTTLFSRMKKLGIRRSMTSSQR
ncbi:MAG: GAF domain-containing protein [Desulfobacteraceae bacterium]|nr:MAG: GAF domain-containing protein [Desulfobacteraceae bacterium]